MNPWDRIPGCNEGGVLTLKCIPTLFQIVVYWGLVLAGLIALFYFIFSGLKFILSGAEAKKIEEARHTIQYAILGFILVLSAFIIINVIATVTGAKCINLFGFGNCG